MARGTFFCARIDTATDSRLTEIAKEIGISRIAVLETLINSATVIRDPNVRVTIQDLPTDGNKVLDALDRAYNKLAEYERFFAMQERRIMDLEIIVEQIVGESNSDR